eukprot:TRINITY_DN11957_c0_g1_i1.p1 TRINITY_DN11957_c0_g1~~TRINITY_DN11957_c0_g1_i1.p1  ORF type:complete len:336 (+),score=95.77 TRINITY_DN11957_c0_g1_i1:17-1024(+)
MSALRIIQTSLKTGNLSEKRNVLRMRSNRDYRRTHNRSYQWGSHSQTQSRFSEWRSVMAAFGLAGALVLGWTQSEAETVDYDEVRKAIIELLDAEGYDDGSYGPIFIRLAWHSSGTYNVHDKTGGSNAGSIRFAPESEHGANAGLNVARDVLQPLIEKFPGLSYGDLYTLAGAVAVEQLGGPKIAWSPGRKDGTDKDCTPDGRLPDAAQGQDHVRDIFYRMGFNDREIVALAGAHALGRCHTDRSGYSGPWTASPTFFSNDYFVQLIDRTWTPKQWDGPFQYEDETGELMMLPADMAFVKDPEFKKYVELYAEDEEIFFKDFSAAFSKLISLGVN